MKTINMTTIRLTGGSLGRDQIRFCCDYTDAAAPICVDYCEGDGWQQTQFQTADAQHCDRGFEAIAKELAARAVELPPEEFSCEVEVIDAE